MNSIIIFINILIGIISLILIAFVIFTIILLKPREYLSFKERIKMNFSPGERVHKLPNGNIILEKIHIDHKKERHVFHTEHDKNGRVKREI